MRRLIVLFLLLATPAFADPVEEVRQAEIAFAKAFADRDKDRFFGFVADDATFLGQRNAFPGKAEVIKGWSRFFDSPSAPFSWRPERVFVAANGTVGLSTGPVLDPAGKHLSNFSSIWMKQADGRWKVIFDGPGSPVCPTCPSNAAAAPKVEEGFLSADDGTKLFYRRTGTGPTTLIIPLDFVMFEDFRQLADVATVITYDLRNRGRSARAADQKTWTIDHDVRDLEAVRRHFAVQRFVPVGYSYLGKMVVLYAKEHPQRVERIVQLGPVPPRETEYPKHLVEPRDSLGAPPENVQRWREAQAAGMSEKSPREFCDVQWGVFSYLLVGNPANASKLRSGCELQNEWPVNFMQHMQVHYPSVLARPLTDDEIRSVTIPVLTIHGTRDRNAPYGAGRHWAVTLPNARLVTVDGAAHQSWTDAPDVVFSAIREFLKGDWPKSAEKIGKLDPRS